VTQTEKISGRFSLQAIFKAVDVFKKPLKSIEAKRSAKKKARKKR